MRHWLTLQVWRRKTVKRATCYSVTCTHCVISIFVYLQAQVDMYTHTHTYIGEKYLCYVVIQSWLKIRIKLPERFIETFPLTWTVSKGSACTYLMNMKESCMLSLLRHAARNTEISTKFPHFLSSPFQPTSALTSWKAKIMLFLYNRFIDTKPYCKQK